MYRVFKKYSNMYMYATTPIQTQYDHMYYVYMYM